MYFLQFILTGFIIAAPVGPMALICIEKTLLKGWKVGILTGLMIALADLTYSILAVTGSSTIINILTGYTYIFKILGGIFLVYLGWTLLSKKNTEVKETPDLKSKIKDFGSVYLLTLSNPSTILVFMSLIFTMQSMVKTAGSFLVVLGIFTGSILWWLFLVTLVFLSKSKLKPNQIDFISRLGGVALILFGIFSSIF